MVSALALNTGVALALATLGVSLLLAFVSLVSYRRLGSAKLLIAGGAFLVLAIKGGIAAWRAFSQAQADLASLALDFLVLAFLYFSVAKR